MDAIYILFVDTLPLLEFYVPRLIPLDQLIRHRGVTHRSPIRALLIRPSAVKSKISLLGNATNNVRHHVPG